MMKNKAVFLDRDGVINKKAPEKDFIKSIEELEYFPDVRGIINELKKMGYLIIVISNQSGVNRGIIKKLNLKKIDGILTKELNVDGIYYCPHTPEENCKCRKPKTGLIERAVRDFCIDIKNSWLIGDKEIDISAGRSAGCKTIMVDGNKGLQIENVTEIYNAHNKNITKIQLGGKNENIC